LLSSLAPSASTSAALASSSTLGQNPLAPTSALERVGEKEDRAVRRGINTLRKRFGGSEDGSGSESEKDVVIGKNGKKRAVEVVEDIQAGDGAEQSAAAPPKGKVKKIRQKKVRDVDAKHSPALTSGVCLEP
jgi:ATP-dependent RNA helicase DHX37/DHR1